MKMGIKPEHLERIARIFQDDEDEDFDFMGSGFKAP